MTDTITCVVNDCTNPAITRELNNISQGMSLNLCSDHGWDLFWAQKEKSRRLAAAISEANPGMQHTEGFVYIIRLSNSHIKLGFTTDPSLRRLKTLSGKPNQGIPVQVLAVLEGGESLEAVIHERWKHLRVDGSMEEFWPDPTLLEWASQQGITDEVDDLEDWLVNKHKRASQGEYAQEMFGDVWEQIQQLQGKESEEFWN